ncbi:hypothetical protein MHU86_12628 [Fragilaria crotonensis]|nr:hypothetical protein MHU86_12628 [Fragilaria crotonensis]
MHLPPHRVARLYAILTELQPPRKRMLTTRWHQILGELRSMSPALPGTRGLFSVLQATLSRGDRHRVRLNQHVYNTASDFRALVDSVATRPTRLRELVPTAPSDIGACDACRTGMGGVWFDAVDPSSAPVLWRHRFPANIADSLITADHPRGSLSISDLELAGVVAHKAVLASMRDVAERTVWLASDNRAAVAWSNKGSATSLAARAHLLRYTALHQRRHRYVTRNHYIPGPVNVMADDASRLWHLSDAALLTHFDTVYPQAVSWCMRTLPPATSAIVIGALSNIPQPCAALLSEVPTQPPHGTSGRPSVPVSVSMHTTSPPLDPVPLLLLFAQRYRTGALAPGRRSVRARTVEDAVRAVGQAYTGMGAADPRLNAHGQLDSRLRALFHAWATADDPPSRVKPLPLPLVAHVWHHAALAATPHALAASCCLVIGFYFLLRPGEYLGTPRPTQFRFGDVRFWIGSRALDHTTCPAADLVAATFVTLTFNRQKNGVRNETVGHGRSGHAHLCPVHALATRVLALRTSGAGLSTPLNAVRPTATSPWSYVLPSDLTTRLRAALSLHPDPAYAPSDVSIRSTRAGLPARRVDRPATNQVPRSV